MISDEPQVRRALARTLRAAGYHVSVTSSRAALARLRREPFDLLAGSVESVLDHIRLHTIRPIAEFAGALVTESSHDSLATALMRRVRGDVGASFVWLWLAGDDAVHGPIGPGASAVRPDQVAALTDRLLEQYPRGVKPRLLAVDQLAGGDDPAAWPARESWEQVILLPLPVNGRRIGVLFAAGKHDTLRTSAGALNALRWCAVQAAVAIENVRLYQEARDLSLTDAHTGLPNARFLAEHLPRLVAQARRSGRPLSILFVDSDSLKIVNDRFGHDAGNRFARQLAGILRYGVHGPHRSQLRGSEAPTDGSESSAAPPATMGRRRGPDVRVDGLRQGDIIVRYTGGDEFIVLMPDTDAAQSLVVAERLRAAVELVPFVEDGQTVRCTVSIGAATSPQDASTADELLRCADIAMYEAKRRGKNRVVSYGDAPTPNRTCAGTIAQSTSHGG